MKYIKKSGKIRQYWRRMMDSNRCRMTCGASHIFKTISWARNENWRRMDRKMKKSPKG